MTDIFSRIRFGKDELTGQEIQQAKDMMTAYAPTGIAQLILVTKIIELLDDNGLIPTDTNGRKLFSEKQLGIAVKANQTLLNKRFPDLQSLNVESTKNLSQEQLKALIADLLGSSTGMAALKDIDLRKIMGGNNGGQ
jgi:hypothetical protein